ncbi:MULTISPECIES: class I lanthipeptide [Aquimarina]|uniref:class I lanthipeptide n=1 Tax=Aquimarina TaxID=290174 RepID=UPI000462F91E|nr:MULTISPECIES: class I lanthipeptide [Aquimarina]
MKKKKLSNLNLNKKTISKLNSSKIIGGRDSRPTVPTLELSYCVGIPGVPAGCMSVNPCA